MELNDLIVNTAKLSDDKELVALSIESRRRYGMLKSTGRDFTNSYRESRVEVVHQLLERSLKG